MAPRGVPWPSRGVPWPLYEEYGLEHPISIYFCTVSNIWLDIYRISPVYPPDLHLAPPLWVNPLQSKVFDLGKIRVCSVYRLSRFHAIGLPERDGRTDRQ